MKNFSAAWKFIIFPIIVAIFLTFFATRLGILLLTFVDELDLPFFSFFSSVIIAALGIGNGGSTAAAEDFLVEIPKTLSFLAFFYYINALWEYIYEHVFGKSSSGTSGSTSGAAGTTKNPNEPKWLLLKLVGTFIAVCASGFLTSTILKYLHATYVRVIACVILSVASVVVMVIITRYQMVQRGITRASVMDVLVEIAVKVILKSAILIAINYILIMLIYLAAVYLQVSYAWLYVVIVVIAIIGGIGAGIGLFNEKDTKKNK